MQTLSDNSTAAPKAAPNLFDAKKIYYNLLPDQLEQQTLQLGQGRLSEEGALCVNTGKFTGRSPKDKFIVKDAITTSAVDWGNVNIPISTEVFNRLYDKVIAYLADKEIWIRDVSAAAYPEYNLKIQVINETPWANLFCYNLFIDHSLKTPATDSSHQAKWQIIQAPGFLADPSTDGTRQANFTIINFTKRIVLIGGTAYTGEIKKGIFSVLNFLLPHDHKVLSMHCSANEGQKGDVALFFGLSGTGKTTLSAAPDRALIGDDEHGWAEHAIFNFEGGCYAKCINLSPEKEPEIAAAIKKGTLLENVSFYPGENRINYADASITENTRAAYPLSYIKNAKHPSFGNLPSNIFFLTCDAFGVLPPISKLTRGQAMYHFVSGYTAKVAGTEVGIKEPQTVFSACFGHVFLPLHPTEYAELLGRNLQKHPQINVWLINTGWSGGAYGTGKRIDLKYTRAMVLAALNNQLEDVPYIPHDVFGVLKPQYCPGVPSDILNPRAAWPDKAAYDQQANKLASLFIENFKLYEQKASASTRAGGPKIIR
ncbi:phosphoenolpyruvate carboxykinase (ATP) [Arachidicoccus rhizosphaerae]|jgi:phosphoenolpyruvate carboxykinase (ATP)|uniref:Phosphoenolpyruvate carboxykinase (ATP) n=1 Tax=Arachidicoccus rhizosphaerae TaxID=551991 RepID=A0A1H3YJB2_9BACT|nr:phosphoenolpyruvate carboxykinase (ATP) [Arachidicoccus rhizosphaerae]SEA11567.1 phosphoenolpyruvate carboxykinase (ATP) [Arachidicoccus rhizosphaerae]